MAKPRPSGVERNDSEPGKADLEKSIESVMTGELKSIPAEHGRAMLEVGFDIPASDGNSYHFGKELVVKYKDGIKQDGTVKSEGSDIDRFRHLPYATNAMKSNDSEIYEQTQGVKQKLFLRRQGEKMATAVYVDSNNKVVMSYIFMHKNKSQVDKFMKKRLHGMDE